MQIVVKIQHLVSELLILLYSLLIGNSIEANQETGETYKNVLVIIPLLGIGDVVCSTDFIRQLRNIYQTDDKYKIYLALDKKLLNFTKLLFTDCEMNYIPLEMDNDYERGFKRYKKIINLLRQNNWNIIVATQRVGIYFKLALLTLSFRSAYIIDYFNITPSYSLNNMLNKYLESKSAVHIARVAPMDMIISNMNKLMQLIVGQNDVSVGISNIKQFENVNFPHQPYCIISCGIGKGHSYAYRSWKPEHYATVANYIIQNFHLKVYLSGGKDDIAINEKVYNAVMDHSHIINVTGKTNLKEWIELIRHAKFLLGNDSGYIHLAAAVNTQAFCIGGFWNYGKYFPYTINRTQLRFKTPIFIHAAEPCCKWCSMKKLWRDETNAQIAENLCKKNVRQFERCQGRNIFDPFGRLKVTQ